MYENREVMLAILFVFAMSVKQMLENVRALVFKFIRSWERCLAKENGQLV